MNVVKIPNLVCDRCGSFRVIMTDVGPECQDCFVVVNDDPVFQFDITEEMEYFIYQSKLYEGVGDGD